MASAPDVLKQLQDIPGRIDDLPHCMKHHCYVLYIDNGLASWTNLTRY